ncbi:glycosyltransferase [Runella sp. CRIBMP]|uniref:glycosyltransferase family 4 protein n=1 Tax=Runella sp. CRIBMP TaxID=2683261 RepID=UPI0014128166|nr:glycosyltransferase family 4 protein [Runella sp. CRIBMP]NBB19422.1 glycosyltransferase [Runella sp. CRIBMP]
MSLKILIASFGFYPETHGIAQAAYQQAMGLHRLGYSITVVTQVSEQPYGVPFEVIALPLSPSRLPKFDEIEVGKTYQQFLKESNFDVLFFHCWESWVSELALPILNQIQGKKVLVSHGTTIHLRYPGIKGWLRWLRNRPAAWQFSKKLTAFDYYVFLSEKPDRQRLFDVIQAKRLGLHNFSIIPNGAHPSFFQQSNTDFWVKFGLKKARMLLCVGNFSREKGQRELIKWFIEISPKDTILVLIGSHFNDYSNHLKKAIGERLNTNIFLFEKLPLEDIHAAYCAATLFVSATFTEVQPLVLLDAMAVGLPFLCRDVGAVSTLAGSLCFKDKNEFKLLLTQLLRNPSPRQNFGNKGKTAALTIYHWDLIAKSYQSLIQQLSSAPNNTQKNT